MSGSPEDPKTLEKCLKASIEGVRSQLATMMDIEVPAIFNEEEVSRIHLGLTKAIKTWFFIRTRRVGGGLRISMFLDKDMIDKLMAVEDLKRKASIPSEFVTDLKSSFIECKNVEGDGWKMVPRRLAEIDPKAFKASAGQLAKLVDCHIKGKVLCVSVDERMRYAHRMLLNFLTLVEEDELEWAFLAMLHSALEMGANFGIPVVPRTCDEWAETLGAGHNFKRLASETYDFLVFEQYVATLFPNIPLQGRGVLLRGYKEYIKDLRKGSLHETLSNEIVEATGMSRDRIRERIEEKGLVYD